MTKAAVEVALLDATAQAELVRSGDVSASEMVMWAIERIETLNPSLNAVVTTMFDSALAAASSRSSGAQDAQPFAGVPYLVKDLVVEIEGAPFTEGSRFLRDHVSSYTSELAKRLQRAGLIILGKTNTSEFGMSPSCEPALFGPTHNPWDVSLSTSGSSGGSAAAVASGMVAMAHGNDLGGSIRYPASACGLFGLKPTRARNPLGPEYGDAVSGWAVEHALTRSVRDSAALLDATSGPMPGDPYPAPHVSRPFSAEVGIDPGRLRLAYTARQSDGTPGHPDCVAALEDAVSLLDSLGHEMVESDLPGLTTVRRSIGRVFDAATGWIVGYWVRKLGREPDYDELEPLTRAYWEAGRRLTAVDYLLAIEDVQEFGRVVAAFLQTYDGWITPTMSSPPVELGYLTSTEDEPWRAAGRGGETIGYPGVVANLTGNPAMSVPLSWNEAGLPIGVHVLGRFGDEATLIRLASQLEAARPWHARRPPQR